MRKLSLAALVLVTGCSTASAQVPVHGVTPGRTCQSAGLEAFVGRLATAETGTAILRASQAAVLRWVVHGTMITMEFRADRVTVYLGEDRRIARINCG